jgi:hypothetical protein
MAAILPAAVPVVHLVELSVTVSYCDALSCWV